MTDYLFVSDEIKTHDGFDDSMRACLDAAEKHGIVFGQAIEDRESLIETARRYLPQHSLTSEVNVDCYLIKQTVIDLFGAPVQTDGDHRAALAEYCKKISGFGFSAVVAHHALYSRKDGSLRGVGGTAERTNKIDPTLRFLTVLDDQYFPKKRILFECVQLPDWHNGTTEVALAAFKAFYRLYKEKYDIFLYISRDAAKYHNLTEEYGNILYPDTISGTFHLGYTPMQMMWYEPQRFMNKHCLKIVQQVQDIIILRAHKFFDSDVRDIFDLGVNLCDAYTFVSNYSKSDFLTYFSNYDFDKQCKMLKVIYNAKEMRTPVSDDFELPFDNFFLISGNTFKHKAVNEAIQAVTSSQHNFIVIGAEKTGLIGTNVYGYPSGRLDEDFVHFLYANCNAVIFPSLYEGFGLPTVMGLINGKRVVLHNNALNRELQGHFSQFGEYFLFFNAFEQIADILESTDFTSEATPPLYDDSWERAAVQLESFFDEVLSKAVNTQRLYERHRIFKQLDSRAADIAKLVKQLREELHATQTIPQGVLNPRGGLKLLRLMLYGVKENIKHRHPKLFGMLKKARKG